VLEKMTVDSEDEITPRAATIDDETVRIFHFYGIVYQTS
jgi:hypothetical protein